ncbi:DMT family transporter [Pseudovibrio exalbescens]|uniref:Transporter n=1 Tax=Pseudovibrio exalbescens TaxID=197461 RepID=A0A1U7JD68_9HYPH|nr:EamA family transporter [Pseudovibrio exalbescens]OKL42700.1 transporter [Pseudovibrio exalbescens]
MSESNTQALSPLTAAEPAIKAVDLMLYGACVFAWGFSWYAIKMQAGVAPEVSLFWRFVMAALCMFGWAVIGRHPLRFSLRHHAGFALMGLLIFSTNFLTFYYGAFYIPSGLLSVVFSLTSVFNIMLAFLLFGEKASRRTLLGALTGFAGVALMFRPQIIQGGMDEGAFLGLVLCITGTLSFCGGNMLSSRLQKRSVSVISASAWGMVYGALFLGAEALLMGRSFQILWTPTYLSSLLYLAIIASVVAFGSYLTLLGRVGSARAGYATVMFPLVALTVSTVMEGFTWGFDALLGLVCVLAGNIIVLGKRRKSRP